MQAFLPSDHPIDETRRRVAKVARKHNKFAGTVGNPGNFDQLVKMGYNFISLCAVALALFQKYCFKMHMKASAAYEDIE